jgi:heavy metal sensor kinase
MNMKSIRLSLIVYFLLLLAVALGAVAGLDYWNTSTIVQERREAMRKSLCASYERRCQRAREKFDDGLLNQARTLASLAQFQHQSNRSRLPTLVPLGILTAGVNASGYALIPVWLGECSCVKGALSYRVYRLSTGEIEFREGDMPVHPDGPITEYFQVTSEWGNTWHSRTMDYEDYSFPAGPEEFAAVGLFQSKFDDFEMPMGTRVRRVTLKAPVVRFLYRYEGETRPSRPSSDTSPSRAQPATATERVAESTTPAFLIHCAADTATRDSLLQQYAAERVQELARMEEESAQTLAAVRYRLVLIALVTFVATVIGGFVLVRVGLSPLQRLSVAVSRVSEKDMRLQFDEPQVPSELRPIVERLAQTLEQLQRAFLREKQATADISHELRTPLAALLTTTEVGLRKPRPAEEYRQLLADCRAIGKQLSQQVERLLALARLDAGVDTLRPQRIDVTELARQCAELVRPLAEARELSLHVHQDGPATLTTDADKLREVLTNLLHNAIEYNRPQGRVDLTVKRDNGTLHVEVSDTGIGIAPEARQHIFQRFFRADPSRQEAGLHAGLGLAIVKGYVDLMGGTISVESVPEQGSTFRLSLPATGNGEHEAESNKRKA